MSQQYDSKEEIYMVWWLQELKDRGYIKEYEYQPLAFPLSSSVEHRWVEVLKTKCKAKTCTMLREHSYSADFRVVWAGIAEGPFIAPPEKKWTSAPIYADAKGTSWIDVKPAFQRHEARSAIFAVNQKWVFQKFNIYIQPIVVTPNCHGLPTDALFSNTFVPKRFLWTDKGKSTRRIPWAAAECYLESYISNWSLDF
jgi:ribosomal protein S8